MSACRAFIICNSYRQENDRKTHSLRALAGPRSDAKNVSAWLSTWLGLGADEHAADEGRLRIVVKKDQDGHQMQDLIQELSDQLEALDEGTHKPLVCCHTALAMLNVSRSAIETTSKFLEE